MRLSRAILTLALLVPGASALAAPSLNGAINRDMLGATVAYFEAQMGPAWRVEGATRTYKIQGCELAISVDQGSITGFRLPLSAQCSPDLSDFLGEGTTPLHTQTFSQLERVMQVQGEFRSDCLTLCGNAYDPSVYEYWSGYHANGFVDIRIGVMQVSDAALDAANAWQAQMDREQGKAYAQENKFNCDERYHQAGSKAFKNVVIGEIALGQLAAPPTCDKH